MPHSILSKKHLLDNAHRGYTLELFEHLRSTKKILAFHDRLVELLESSTPNIPEQLDIFLKAYPVLCNRVIGFYPDGNFKLRETEPMQMVIPDSSPAVFVPTKDILSSIVQHLPYTALGRLAKTCKWMNANITVDQVERALERARQSFGRVQFFNERRGLRIWNMENEDPIEFGQVRVGSTLIFLRIRGRKYIGYSYTFPFSFEEQAAVGYEGSNTSIWYQAVWPGFGTNVLPSGCDLSVKFKIRRGGSTHVKLMTIFFDECVDMD